MSEESAVIEAESQRQIIELIELLLDERILSQEQADALTEIALESLPFYRDNPELARRLQEIAAELAHVSAPNMTSSDADKAIPPGLVEKLLDLPKACVQVDVLEAEDLSREEQLDPFVGVGLFRRLGGRLVSHEGSFALFPIALSRLTYSWELMTSLTNRIAGRVGDSVSRSLYEISRRVRELPASFGQKARAMAVRGASTFLTDRYQVTGPLTESLNIFEFGRALYCDLFESIFIFATTSGLVIPTEYTGEVDQNYLRRSYFDEGVLGPNAEHLKRYYQWDQIGTALELYRTYRVAEREGRGQEFIQQAKGILARALREENLEITEAEFGAEGGGVKRLLTLSCRGGVVVSTRHPISRRIAYGHLLEGVAQDTYLCDSLSHFTSKPIIPAWSPSLFTGGKQAGALTYAEAIRECIYNTEIVRRIKEIGEKLDYAAASEIVDRLLSEGELLSRQHS